MKYIDADALKIEIKHHIELMENEPTRYAKARIDEANEVLSVIDSLQREMWKPSKEQMRALYSALNDAILSYSDKISPLYEEVSRKHFDTLESLYNNLQKLM